VLSQEKTRATPLEISIRRLYNGMTSYVRFSCHSTAFLMVFFCRLQWTICQKVTSSRKKQSDRIFDGDKYITVMYLSASITNIIIIQG